MNKVSSFLIFSSYVNPSYTLLLPSQQHVKIHQNHLVKRDSVSLLLKIGEDDDSNNPDAFSLKETLPVPSKVYASTRKKLGLKDKHFLESTLFISFPLLVALVSWFLYPTTSIWFHQAVQILGNNKWEPIDGGTLQWTILLPALNGVVMTCISLLYANLISTTGTQLRSRQITIHESLSTEVVNIRGMAQLIHYYPETLRDEFGAHLYHYTTDIMDEISSTPEDLESSNGNLDNYRNTLHYCGANDQFPASNIMDQSYETLTGIYQARNTRIVAVQTRFPSLHYVTITALTLTILLIFLLETDRKVILFLDKFQIRTVWALLVGTVTAIYCIGIDLAYPFIGTYTVPADELLEDDDLLGLLAEATNPISSNTKFTAGDQNNYDSRRENNSLEPAADGGLSAYDSYMKQQ